MSRCAMTVISTVRVRHLPSVAVLKWCLLLGCPAAVFAAGDCYTIQNTACCNWMTIYVQCDECAGVPEPGCCWVNAEKEPATTNKLFSDQATGYDASSIYIKILQNRCRYRKLSCDPLEGCLPGPVQTADCFAAGSTATGYNCGI
jgi:hypothetical protein